MAIYIRTQMTVKELDVPLFSSYCNALAKYLNAEGIYLTKAFTYLTGNRLTNDCIPVDNYWSAADQCTWQKAWDKVTTTETYQKLLETLQCSEKSISTEFFSEAPYQPNKLAPSDLPEITQENSLVIAADDGLLYLVPPAKYHKTKAPYEIFGSQSQVLIDQGVVLAALPTSTLPVRGSMCYFVNIAGIRNR